MKRSGKSKTKAVPRNWYAVHAFQRGGAGNHGDKKKERSKTRVANGRLIVEIIEKLFDMFLHAAAIYAALKVMYVALMCGAIYLVFKALR